MGNISTSMKDSEIGHAELKEKTLVLEDKRGLRLQ
jgi:hypothetical protein